MSYLGLEMCGQDTGPKDMSGQFVSPVVNFLVPAMLECNAKYKHVVQVIYLELKLGPSALRVWKQQYLGHASMRNSAIYARSPPYVEEYSATNYQQTENTKNFPCCSSFHSILYSLK